MELNSIIYLHWVSEPFGSDFHFFSGPNLVPSDFKETFIWFYKMVLIDLRNIYFKET